MPTLLQTAITAYLITVCIMSVVTFVAYGLDKRKAKLQGWRTPEQTLHLLALLGGWPGALLGQNLFRHKTQKLSFRIVFWLVILIHISLVVAIGYGLLHWSRESG